MACARPAGDSITSSAKQQQIQELLAKMEARRPGLGGSGAASAAFDSPSFAGDAARPHSSLVATPSSRHTGGRLVQRPSVQTLTQYERGVEAEAGYSPYAHSTAAARAAAPTTRFTPRDPSPLRYQAAAVGSIAAASPLPRKPSLLEQSLGAQAAGKAGRGDPLATYRASPAAAALAQSAELALQLRRMELSCSRMAAQNSAVVSSAGVTASPLRPVGGHRAAQPLAGQLPRQQPQPQQQHDFRIPAAFPGGAAAAAPASSRRAADSMLAGAARVDESDLGISMRLTPLFNAMGSSSQQQHPASEAAGDPIWMADHAALPHTRQPSWQQQASPRAFDAAAGPSATVLKSRVNELQAQVGMGGRLEVWGWASPPGGRPAGSWPIYTMHALPSLPTASDGAHSLPRGHGRQRWPEAAAGRAATAGAAAGGRGRGGAAACRAGRGACGRRGAAGCCAAGGGAAAAVGAQREHGQSGSHHGVLQPCCRRCGVTRAAASACRDAPWPQRSPPTCATGRQRAPTAGE